MIGAVLCGGKSRRMGRPKALLPWGRTDLLGHALSRLSDAGLHGVCVGPQAWAQSHGARALDDAVFGAGPLGGILAAVREDDVFVLAVDMPLLTVEEIRALWEAGARRGALTLPAWDGMLQALCGYWPAAAAEPLADYLARGSRKVIDFAQRVPHRCLDQAALRSAGIDPGHLRGLNTPEEYATALAAAGLHQEEKF